MFDTDEKLHENFIFNLKKTIKRKNEDSEDKEELKILKISMCEGTFAVN